MKSIQIAFRASFKFHFSLENLFNSDTHKDKKKEGVRRERGREEKREKSSICCVTLQVPATVGAGPA